MASRPAGEKHAALDNEQDSELSDPDSNVRTPPRVSEEEIVVGSKVGRSTLHLTEPAGAAPAAATAAAETMTAVEEEPLASHYPKRKRTSIFNDLSESKIEIPTSTRADRAERTALPSNSIKVKPRNSLGGVKGVLVGHWRDSMVPELENKHAVIGFIDVRDRLRTRIQPMNKSGETISHEYPLPPGPGGSWVTFDRIYFSDPLVGLDHYQIKEYVRMRTDAGEATDEERLAAEQAAVKAATTRGRELLQKENPVVAPAIAYGAIPTDSSLLEAASDGKRRRTSSSFVAIASQDDTSGATQQHAMVLDPLHGTRPTRIVLGYWRGSNESNPRDRHAVYGILGQNDMFRVKVVRETRDGRYVDGNFPSGAGALWIHYDEVEFEPHLKDLSRPEIKEYCRIRQYQVDHGETAGERKVNEDRAAADARVRATAYLPTHHLQGASVYGKAYPYRDLDNSPSVADSPSGRVSGGHELRQLRRPESRSARDSFSDAVAETNGAGTVTVAGTAGTTSSSGRMPSAEAIERANALAQREIARVEAAQGRADRHAVHRERAAQAADAAAASAAASVSGGTTTAHSPTMTNGHVGVSGGSRGLFHESEDIERLNRVWARQESLRLRGTTAGAGGGIEEAKFYDGVKYERKPTGPFMGKLVSQGTIITIDGEDYVEYRVLTKPSFF